MSLRIKVGTHAGPLRLPRWVMVVERAEDVQITRDFPDTDRLVVSFTTGGRTAESLEIGTEGYGFTAGREVTTPYRFTIDHTVELEISPSDEPEGQQS